MEQSLDQEALGVETDDRVICYLDTFKCGLCLLELNDLEVFLEHKRNCFVAEIR